MSFLRKTSKPKGRKTVVLLGDSVIDNKLYTDGGPSTGEYVQSFLGSDWDVIDQSCDGAIAYDVWAQIADIPDNVDQIILSVGGNDALSSKPVLSSGRSVGEGLAKIGGDVDYFQSQYSQLLDALKSWACPLTVCTVYNGSFKDTEKQAIIPAVRLFNDAIYSTANAIGGVSVIDLRTIVTDDRDFWNPIEPGNLGGAKIAAAFASACLPAGENQSSTSFDWSMRFAGRRGGKTIGRSGGNNWLDTPTRLIDFDDESYVPEEIDWSEERAEELMAEVEAVLADGVTEPSSSSGTYEGLWDLEDGTMVTFNDDDDQRFDTVMATEIGNVSGLGRRITDL